MSLLDQLIATLTDPDVRAERIEDAARRDARLYRLGVLDSLIPQLSDVELVDAQEEVGEIEKQLGVEP